MRRVAITGGLAAALIVAAVALGAATDVRIHRLHVPPPPVEAVDSPTPIAPGTPSPPDPSLPPAPPGTPQPPTAPPPPAPPPPAGVSCTASNAGTPVNVTGTEIDEGLSIAPASLAAVGTLRIRGVNTGSEDHTIAIRPLGGAFICGTPVIPGGAENTFSVTNLAAGTYQVYCTIHPTTMRQNLVIS